MPPRNFYRKVCLFAILLLVAASTCQGETWKLKLVPKVPEANDDPQSQKYPEAAQLRGYPQIFTNREIARIKKIKSTPPKATHEEFDDLVKKQPAYVSSFPLKGFVQFGEHRFAIVVDNVPKTPNEEEEFDFSLKRLYLDFNRNNDLTDDEPITEKASLLSKDDTKYSSSRFTFSLPLEEGGKKSEVLCTFIAGLRYRNIPILSPDGAQSSIQVKSSYGQFYTNCFREGRLRLGDKTFRAILVDYNNNGRFDDAVTACRGYRVSKGDRLYLFPEDTKSPQFAVDFVPAESGQISPLYVGPVVGALQGKFWHMTVTPSGDQLTLTPFVGKQGYLQNPIAPFVLKAFNKDEQSCMLIPSDENGKATLPLGEWIPISYATDFKTDKKDATEKAATVIAWLDVRNNSRTEGIQNFKIAENEVTEMKFGPPYKLELDTHHYQGKSGEHVVMLQLKATGMRHESCTSVLFAGGKRPSKPKFIITTKDGKEVESGSFEYG